MTDKITKEDIVVDELCCGVACDRDKRDGQVKVLGAHDYLALVFSKLNLTTDEKEELKSLFKLYQSSMPK